MFDHSAAPGQVALDRREAAAPSFEASGDASDGAPRGETPASARILLAEGDPVLGMDLAGMLTEAGFSVAGLARNGEEAVLLASALRPDLVVLDVAVSGVHGLTAAGPISERQIPVILLMAPSGASLVHEAVTAGAMAWLVKPVAPPSLVATAHMVLARHAENTALRQSLRQIQSRIEEHKLVERAKGLLMARHAVAESVAAEWMRQTAQDTGSPLARVAAAIVDEWAPQPRTGATSARGARSSNHDWLPLAMVPKPAADPERRVRPRRRDTSGATPRG